MAAPAETRSVPAQTKITQTEQADLLAVVADLNARGAKITRSSLIRLFIQSGIAAHKEIREEK